MTPSPLDLSVGQQALWLQYRLAPDSAAYNDAGALLLRPRPDVAALNRAVRAVLDRHDLLRSRFVEHAGQPGRVVDAPGRSVLQVRDVAGVDDRALHAMARQVCTAPFRLDADGPFRVVLLRREADAVLVVVTHHIATDAQSQRIVWRDLMAAYRSTVHGTPTQWPQLTATFDDYVRREHELLSSPRGAEFARYWEGLCRGARAATLPTDRPRPATPAFAGATRRRPVPAELADRVRAAASAASCTPFALLLGAFHATLHRYTGQADLTVGVPASTRRVRPLRDLVGLLVNTIVVRADFTPWTTLGDTVGALNRQLADSLRRVTYPYAHLGVGHGREPLFRTAITMVKLAADEPLPDGRDGSVETFGFRAQRLDVPQLEGQLDLTVEVTHRPDGLSLEFRYDTELFDADTVDRLVDHYLRVVDLTCRRPGERVVGISLIDTDELSRLLAIGSG